MNETKNLESLLSIGRKDSDFDLFCRRFQMAERFLNLPPEAMVNITFADWYADFWKLAGETHRESKFSADEKNLSRQILEQARQENNPVRRQYLALILILFGDFQAAQQFIDQRFCSPQLMKDLITFANWNALANNSLTLEAQAKISRNDQILAFLQEKYSALIQKYSRAVINDKTCPRVRPKDYKIFFCWFQGEENLPPLVRCCYNSLKQNAGRYKIVFIDEKNFLNYVDIAPHIMDKYRAGKITRTHLSDVLRINLLERHGGLWFDSTILVTEPLERHKEFWQMDYFTQKYYNEVNYSAPYTKFIGHCVSYGRWTGFFQSTAILHNPLFAFEKEFFSAYFAEYDELIDYVFMDFMMALAYRNIPVARKNFDAVPINNLDINTLVFHLNDPYAIFPYDKIFKNSFLHKLSWKVPIDTARTDTVFREIQRRYAPETIQR